MRQDFIHSRPKNLALKGKDEKMSRFSISLQEAMGSCSERSRRISPWSFIVFILIVSFLLLNSGLGFSEETQKAPKAENAGSENEVQWLWGEASSVDAQKGEITVKYLDYETDSEKEATVIVDDKTIFENVSSILDIKPSDMLSIDYIVADNGNYIAKKISLEKPEAMPESKEAPQESLP